MIKKKLYKIIRHANSYLIRLGFSIQGTFLDNDLFNNEKIYLNQNDLKKQFNYIYKNNIWGSKESVSGPGSEIQRTKKYRNNLKRILLNYNIKNIFDSPCGDFNWMSRFLTENKGLFNYYGADIVEDIILKNIREYKDHHFEVIDLTKNTFPKADVFHCRDLLFHLSYHDISKIFSNFIESEISYILVSNHESNFLKNIDIKSGGFRYLDIRKKPFLLNNYLEKIDDYYFLKSFPKKSYLFNREQFISQIKNFQIFLES